MAIMKHMFAFLLAAAGVQAAKYPTNKETQDFAAKFPLSKETQGCKPGCSVAFVGGRLETWDRYQQGKKEGEFTYLGGESYWAAGLAKLLEKSGHKVTFYKPQGPTYGLPAEAKKACRIVADSFHKWAWKDQPPGFVKQKDVEQNAQQEQLLANARMTSYFDELKKSDPELLSRMRVLHWWGGYHGPYRNHTLVPFSAFEGPALPFPVHAQLLQSPNWKKPEARGRKAFLFGKGQLEAGPGKYSEEFCDNYVKALLDAKFEVHTTAIKCKQFPNVKTHGMLTPPEFGKLLGTMAVVIGLGQPKDSPSPFEAMAGGAPFLNPFQDKNNKEGSSQVKLLFKVDEPMVYSYDFQNTSSMVEAANKAVDHFIPRYVPEGHKPEDVEKAMCKLIFN